MASIKGNALSGVIGNLVFYEMNGKRYVRTKPGPRVKKKGYQPAKEVTDFSLASSKGSPMLKWLLQQTGLPGGLKTFNSFRGWLMQNMRARHGVDSWPIGTAVTPLLNLNQHCDLRDQLLVMPSFAMNGNSLHCTFPGFIPSQHIIAPAGTTNIRMQLLTCTNSFASKAADTTTGSMAKLAIAYGAKMPAAAAISLPIVNAKDTLTVVCLTMEYFTENGKPVMQDKWRPAAMVAIGKL